jgi:hypothetical protein
MECHRERFPMIEELPGEATSPSKKNSDPMPELTIIPLYSHRVRFTDQPAVIGKGLSRNYPR